ncbi:hypothetical protein QBC40DRAFT_257925 [Triangularia verruculosa]|uniref:Uncharacterized protein n=1 Tax=Triangularia verruculosa TaxID=2587418 RepID=A0AAN6XA85_9PEZI|nr:hypothetical protein QBC40DRAFT_257925 [Triangularia verruculosa]
MSGPSRPRPALFAPVMVPVRFFYRMNTFHSPEEFVEEPLPPHVVLTIDMSSTLEEVSHLLANHPEKIIPSPSFGTRLVFHEMEQSLHTQPPRAPPGTRPKFWETTHGSYVIGRGYPGIDLPAVDKNEATSKDPKPRWLENAMVTVTIQPPNEKDISVAPAPAARNGRASGAGEIESRRSNTPGKRRGADGHSGKGVPLGDSAKGEGRDDTDEDIRLPRRNNGRVSKGTSRGPPSSRTRDHDRRNN